MLHAKCFQVIEMAPRMHTVLLFACTCAAFLSVRIACSALTRLSAPASLREQL